MPPKKKTSTAQTAAAETERSVSRSSSESPYSYRNTTNFVQENFALIIMAVLFFVAGFFMGSIWTENKMLKGGKAGTSVTATAPSVGTDTTAPTQPDGPTPEQLAALPEVTDADHVRGNPNAPITLVEYSDFECPFCARFHPTMQQVMDEFGDDVRWVYRHYPLPFHPNAQKAAEASECVAKLGGDDAFWTYADAIIEVTALNSSLTPAAITTAAETTGVSMAEFQTCLDSGEMAQLVADQMAAGSASGVSGTPGTFIVTEDGAQTLIPGAYPFADVQAQINTYLQ